MKTFSDAVSEKLLHFAAFSNHCNVKKRKAGWTYSKIIPTNFKCKNKHKTGICYQKRPQKQPFGLENAHT